MRKILFLILLSLLSLLVPNGEALILWAKNHSVNLNESKGPEAVLHEIESVISQCKPGGIYDDLFPSRWLPAAIAILDEPFNADNRQLNSMGKMVRTKIVERHRDTIDYLYTPEAKNMVNQRNLTVLKRILAV